jgi:hypothetical protein
MSKSPASKKKPSNKLATKSPRKSSPSMASALTVRNSKTQLDELGFVMKQIPNKR